MENVESVVTLTMHPLDHMRLLEAVDLGLRRLAVRDPSEEICSTGLALMAV